MLILKKRRARQKIELVENGEFTPATTITPRVAEVMSKRVRWGIHYNMDTYDGCCFNSAGFSPPNPNTFSLKNIDFTSAANEAVNCGVQIAYINAFHETGFNLWDSDIKKTDYQLEGDHLAGYHDQDSYNSSKNGDPDVVKKFCQAMTAKGIEPWMYVNFSAHWNLFHTMTPVPDLYPPGNNYRAEWVLYVCLLCQELLLRYGQYGLKGLWLDSYAVMTTAEYQKLYNAIKSIDPDCWVTMNMGVSNTFHNYPADAMSFEGYVLWDHPGVTQWQSIDSTFGGVTYKIPKEFILSLNKHDGMPHNWYWYDNNCRIPPAKDNWYWQNGTLRPTPLIGDNSFFVPTATLQGLYDTAVSYNVGFMTSPSLDRNAQIVTAQLNNLKALIL